MVHILLLILKIIGIILLVLLGLLLLLLFVPFTYKAKGSYRDDGFNATISAGWLAHLVHFSMRIKGKDADGKLRILGIPLYSPFKEKNSASGSDNKENRKKKKIQEDNNTKEKEFDEQKTEECKTVETDKEEKVKDKKSILKRVQDFWNKVKNFFIQTKQSIINAIEKYKEIKKVLKAKITKKAYRFLKARIIKILKHIRPRKVRANLKVGFEDPYITGKVLGYIGMAYGILKINPEKIQIEPYFDKKILEGTFLIKGRVVPCVILYHGLRVFFNSEIRIVYKKLKKMSRKEEDNK